MSTTITNYDGSMVTTPEQFARPERVEEIQAIMRRPEHRSRNRHAGCTWWFGR